MFHAFAHNNVVYAVKLQNLKHICHKQLKKNVLCNHHFNLIKFLFLLRRDFAQDKYVYQMHILCAICYHSNFGKCLIGFLVGRRVFLWSFFKELGPWQDCCKCVNPPHMML